jgi:hypothetical protein
MCLPECKPNCFKWKDINADFGITYCFSDLRFGFSDRNESLTGLLSRCFDAVPEIN